MILNCFSQPSQCGGPGRARIAGKRCKSNIEKGIWTGGVGSARTEQNSGARFVDRIVFYRVVGSTGRCTRSGALVVHMNAGLGVAAEDAV